MLAAGKEAVSRIQHVHVFERVAVIETRHRGKVLWMQEPARGNNDFPRIQRIDQNNSSVIAGIIRRRIARAQVGACRVGLEGLPAIIASVKAAARSAMHVATRDAHAEIQPLGIVGVDFDIPNKTARVDVERTGFFPAQYSLERSPVLPAIHALVQPSAIRPKIRDQAGVQHARILRVERDVLDIQRRQAIVF